ncbi:MAG: DNA methylase [Clostridia bacterium]|nr:DNA methylase [Clostridia bacterium]
MKEKTYLCIDLKSFYASVECIERGLDPMKTNLVVADKSRTEKTICLAVTPPLKEYGISGRARLFEVVSQIKKANETRLNKAPDHQFTGESYLTEELSQNLALSVGYLIAPPRMAHYMKYSTRIYDVYLKYIAHDDILVYSIDEVFMDITNYLPRYKMSAHDLAMTILRDVLKTTGITATAGIGTNLYLAKIAMDITAKKMKPDKDGVRIAALDELSYRRQLWEHQPLTDFWRIGSGIAKKLEANRMYCMGDIARASLSPYGREKLKKLFGINAKFLIDHAWGYEPTTIAQAKAYVPETKSICTAQVLSEPYSFELARLVLWEILENLALDLVEKKLLTDQLTLTVGYDVENIRQRNKNYQGEITTDRYGRKTPKHAHTTVNLKQQTSSGKLLCDAVLKAYDEIVDKNLTIRRLSVSANRLISESDVNEEKNFQQLDFFSDYQKQVNETEQTAKLLKKERKIQETVINIKSRYGKNAIMKGANLQKGATQKDRNSRIGGHKA